MKRREKVFTQTAFTKVDSEKTVWGECSSDSFTALIFFPAAPAPSKTKRSKMPFLLSTNKGTQKIGLSPASRSLFAKACYQITTPQ